MILLYRISTPADARKPFVAGIEARAADGIVIRAAPILRRLTMGRRLDRVAELCRQNGWTIEPVEIYGIS